MIFTFIFKIILVFINLMKKNKAKHVSAVKINNKKIIHNFHTEKLKIDHQERKETKRKKKMVKS